MATPTSAAAFNGSTNRLTGSGITYDNAGNLTAHPFITPGGGGMVYNASNKMIQFTATGVSVAYRYDAKERRVRQDSGGQTTIWVYDAFGQLAAEYATNLTMTQGVYYRTTDHLGSTRIVTNQSAAVVQRRDFFPFGEAIPADSSHGNRHLVLDGGQATYNTNSGVKQQFTGQERDQETGLDYFKARNYSAPLGRFLSVDPEGAGAKSARPQSWNAFAYVENQPCTLSDPTGRQAEGPPITGPFIWDALTFYWILQQDASSDTITFLDPEPPVDRALPIARNYANEVTRGTYNDCDALARFAADWDRTATNVNDFVEGFNAFIPENAVSGPVYDRIRPSLLHGADDWQRLSGRDGYLDDYGDTRPNQSQSHHFALYLILGYTSNLTLDELVLQASEFFRDDPGDIELGRAAIRLGHDLRTGATHSNQLSQRISDELCDPSVP
jgi:RHS repeat-associated protein